MRQPLVSAIVLCYNHARFVIECLEGVKAQQYANLELIVNDDASRDRSAEVIQAWLAQSGIRHHFLRNEKNLGVCRSLNNALKVAQGKYVSGIAADDVWLPGKLLEQVALMETLPVEVGVVYSDALQIDEAGNPFAQNFIEDYRSFETMPEGNIHCALWEDNFIPAMTTLIRRDCFDRVGLYDEALFYEDWDMWLRLSQHYNFAYSSRISAKYRHVATSMMRNQSGKLCDAACRVCLKHLQSGKLDRRARRLAMLQLRRKAASSYMLKTPGHIRNLFQAFWYGPSVGIAARLLFSCCGVGGDRFENMRALFHGPEVKGNS